MLELENYKILVDGVLSNLDLDEVVGANKWLAKIGVTSEALVVERYVLALTLCTDSYSSSAQSIWMMALFVSSTQNYTDYFLRLDQLIPPLPSTEDLLFDDQFQPGTRLALQDGLHAKHPVIMIPGIVSTGLEVWNTHPSHSSKSSSTTSSPCGLKYFRKRMWGTLNQLRAVLLDKQCWMDHMLLDNITGLDPPGVKLRAAQGLGAAGKGGGEKE